MLSGNLLLRIHKGTTKVHVFKMSFYVVFGFFVCLFALFFVF